MADDGSNRPRVWVRTGGIIVSMILRRPRDEADLFFAAIVLVVWMPTLISADNEKCGVWQDWARNRQL